MTRAFNLKNCPFCNGEAKLKTLQGPWEYSVGCRRCDFYLPWDSNREQAYQAWNNRVIEKEINDRKSNRITH